MGLSAAPPTLRPAVGRIADDRRRLARKDLGLDASRDDGRGRGNGGWLAARLHEDFAEYISKYEPT